MKELLQLLKSMGNTVKVSINQNGWTLFGLNESFNLAKVQSVASKVGKSVYHRKAGDQYDKASNSMVHKDAICWVGTRSSQVSDSDADLFLVMPE